MVTVERGFSPRFPFLKPRYVLWSSVSYSLKITVYPFVLRLCEKFLRCRRLGSSLTVATIFLVENCNTGM